MLSTCPHCQTRVLPSEDNICPACRKNVLSPVETIPQTVSPAQSLKTVSKVQMTAKEVFFSLDSSIQRNLRLLLITLSVISLVQNFLYFGWQPNIWVRIFGVVVNLIYLFGAIFINKAPGQFFNWIITLAVFDFGIDGLSVILSLRAGVFLSPLYLLSALRFAFIVFMGRSVLTYYRATRNVRA